MVINTDKHDTVFTREHAALRFSHPARGVEFSQKKRCNGPRMLGELEISNLLLGELKILNHDMVIKNFEFNLG